MNRRSFLSALAGLPIVGKYFAEPKPPKAMQGLWPVHVMSPEELRRSYPGGLIDGPAWLEQPWHCSMHGRKFDYGCRTCLYAIQADFEELKDRF